MRPALFYPYFDYLRIALAIGVFLAHADRGEVLPARIGDASVKVFFALSGFLIGGILIRSTRADMPKFFYNRTTRIWIPYAVATALLFLVVIAKQQPLDGKMAEFFFYKVTFVYNWFGPPQLEAFHNQMPLHGTGNHFWSICVEEQFYLVAPLALVWWPRLRVPALVVVWLGSFVVPHYFAGMALGGLLAISEQRFGAWFVQRRFQAALVALIAVCVAATHADLVDYVDTVPIVSIAIVALLAQRGEQSAFGRFVGGVSYPLYLNHWLGLFWMKRLIPLVGFVGATLIAFAISFGVCAAHYLVIDRNIQKYRERFFTDARGRWCFRVGVSLVIVGMTAGLWWTRT